MSASYYLTAMFDNCVPLQQLSSCSMTRPETRGPQQLARSVVFKVSIGISAVGVQDFKQQEHSCVAVLDASSND